MLSIKNQQPALSPQNSNFNDNKGIEWVQKIIDKMKYRSAHSLTEEGSEVALCATSSSEKLPLLNFRRRRGRRRGWKEDGGRRRMEDNNGRSVAGRRFLPHSSAL